MKRPLPLGPQLALAFLTFKGINLLLNALTFPRLRTPPACEALPMVSLLIPARDEAHNLRRHLPGIVAQAAHEVLILDDGSTDETAEVAAACGLRVIRGAPLPPGWKGKSWACHQLAAQASGEILLFLDADVVLHGGAARALAAHLQQHRSGLVSVLPRPQGLNLGTRLLAPLVDVMVLTWLAYPLQWLRWPQASTANAQGMAFRREAYWAAGGHHAVRDEMLEGTALARRVRAAGWPVSKALGKEHVGIRAYRSYAASVHGFSKHALHVHLGSRPLLVALGALHFLVYTLPWIRRPRHPLLWAVRLAGPAERLLVNWLTGRRQLPDLLEALLVPVTFLAALPAYRLALGRQVTWKNRTYTNAAHKHNDEA
ncbi:glycosyltransferase [Deinococcus aquaedulcis]|uniref:glycosyltransferase n=1 Tax=Deinococcus aquaedulcis TaxID=2840455 RepID=UPI001C82B192|nr:glycosyltransferase [Deinococcus aquaedulcis]